MYRKPTHTVDRLLDESSCNPTSHKDLIWRDERNYGSLWHTGQLKWRKQIPWKCFLKNNYNADYIRCNIYRPTEADAKNRYPAPVTTVTTVTKCAYIGHFWGHLTDLTALHYPCSPQTYNYGYDTLLTRANPTKDREQFTGSNAPNAMQASYNNNNSNNNNRLFTLFRENKTKRKKKTSIENKTIEDI